MSSSPPLLSIHQYNPASPRAHRTLLRLLGELNEVIAGSRLAETEYLAWKVTDKQQGPFGFVFGSLWANRETYEKVHALDDFKALVEACEKSGVKLFEMEVANFFELLNPEGNSPPVVLAKLYSTLAMEAASPASVKAEPQLIEILAQGTAAIAEAGHPELRYDLWRVAGKPNGPFTHLYGSLWPSRDIYEAVHAHPAHQSFVKRYGGALSELLGDSLANVYDRLDA